MDSLTAVLARTVYGVEMTNLPLDKLSEQKEKKQRGKGCILEPQKGTAVGRSFSLSWRSHPDVTEPMRFRSATTSGAPGVEKARNTVRQKATEVEEFQQAESTAAADCDYLVVGQQQVPRSSSTSDITERLYSDSSQGYSPMLPHPAFSTTSGDQSSGPHACTAGPLPLSRLPSAGQKVEHSQNLSSSEPKSVQESKGHVTHEHEGITMLVRRSSSPAELELKDDLQQAHGRCRQRQTSESTGSDTVVGYSNEAELPVSPWQACEEDPDLSTPTDAVADSDARHWLQLSPTDASNLTGNCV